MSIFNKIFEGSKRKGIFKKKGDYSVLTDNYVPASLPTYGQGLENFVTADYPMNNPEIIEDSRNNALKKVNEELIQMPCLAVHKNYQCSYAVDRAA